MAIFDHFYARDSAVRQQRYDFVTASEVVEHLFSPGEVLTQLYELLQPGGWLGLMTKMVTDRTAFANWHYKRNPTHVCFFSRQTLAW